MEAVRKGYQAAQGGGAPWFASWVPTGVRRLFPHDFKEMMVCEWRFILHGTDIS